VAAYAFIEYKYYIIRSAVVHAVNPPTP
jgi:hypothetical protein